MEDEIPKLAPPLPELPPTFWEQHGTAMLTGGIVGAIVAVVVVWWMLRARPVAVLPPEVQACRALEALRARSEDGALLSQVSQILHRYLRVAFELPAGELTTAELCQALAQSEKVGPELSRVVSDFLHRCDDRKFSPASVEPVGAVSRALELVALADTRRNVAAGVPPAVEPGVPPGGTGVISEKRLGNSEVATRSSAKPGGRMPPSTSGETPDATYK